MNIAEIRKKIEKILEDAEYKEYLYEGEEIFHYTAIDTHKAENELIELIKEINPEVASEEE